MQKILVTGALGFIGRTLVPALTDSGKEVISSDVFVKDSADYLRADVTSYEDLQRVFRREDITEVIHMAGEVGRMVGEENPQKMLHVNTSGTLNLVKLCLEHEARLLYFSTSEVYGHLFDSGRVLTERDLDGASAFTTTNVYAMSKLFGEAIVRHYVQNYGLKATTIRPFMVYGPGEEPSKYRSALINFVRAAIAGKPIVVHRGAERAWCYVSDFVSGVQIVLEQAPRDSYEAYNLGSSEVRSMEELAQIVVEGCGAKKSLVKVIEPPTQFLSLRKRFSIEKARSLGYKPLVSLRDGVGKVIDWQRGSFGEKGKVT